MKKRLGSCGERDKGTVPPGRFKDGEGVRANKGNDVSCMEYPIGGVENYCFIIHLDRWMMKACRALQIHYSDVDLIHAFGEERALLDFLLVMQERCIGSAVSDFCSTTRDHLIFKRSDGFHLISTVLNLDRSIS